MKELQTKAKVTQTMTRDGLVVENQADGTVENVSSREAEQDYSTDAEGKAEKILEWAEDIKDGHENKKKAKKAAETAATAESEDGLHRSAARLELTEEERADPALQPYIQKAEAKADKLDAARAALPKKRVPVKKKVYDAASGKAKSTLCFEQQDKGPPNLKPNPASRPLSEALLFAHGKIHEVEHENVGVEGGHKGEELVEHQTAKVIRNGIRHHKMKPYKAVEKAERQLMSANAEYFYQKSLRDNPQIAQSASNPISRMWQKQRIKQQYAKAARQAGQAAAQGAATTAENGFRVTKLAAEGGERVAEFAAQNWKTILIVAVFGLLALLLITGLQSCTVMAGTAGTGVTASSYF
ncbi:MAG: NlpC/P60 family protein, partial [Faecalibacterium prausnitzii]|nr:NlpC/P60 family protein [Faecalibacterium prausnitzii]